MDKSSADQDLPARIGDIWGSSRTQAIRAVENAPYVLEFLDLPEAR